MGIEAVGVGEVVIVVVYVLVGIASIVATTPASMVAGKSGVPVGVAVGSVANTIACTVASRLGSGVGVCMVTGVGTDTVCGAVVGSAVTTAGISEVLVGVDSSHAVVESRARVTDTKSESVVKRARVIKPFVCQMSVIVENRLVRWYGNA